MDKESHVLYGGQFFTTLSSFGNLDFFVGQSYSFLKQNQNQEPASSFSYTLGQIEASLLSWLNLHYRVRFDQHSFKQNVSEVGGSIGSAVTSLSGSYVVMRHDKPSDLEEFKNNYNQATKQINFLLTSQITETWSFRGSFMKGIQQKQIERESSFQYGMGACYHVDCVRSGLTVSRQFCPGMSNPETLVMLSLSLKY